MKSIDDAIELAKRMQSLDATARFNMLSYLNSIGKTKNDLIVERKNADGTSLFRRHF